MNTVVVACALLTVLGFQDPEKTQDPKPGNLQGGQEHRGGEYVAPRRYHDHLNDPIAAATRENDPAKRAAELLAGDAAELNAFVSGLAKLGLSLDRGAGTLSFEGEFNRSRMPLEYLIVTPRGSDHEALVRTPIKPSLIASGIYLLGVTQGQNVQYVKKDPPPTDDELRRGASSWETIPPRGDGVYIYFEWEEEGFLRRYRAEDLVITEEQGRAMPWTKWIFIGSRFVRPVKEDPEIFAADAEGDLISICYFGTGNQVLTNPHPQAAQPVFWPNLSLVPPYGTKVRVIFAREALERRPTAADGVCEEQAKQP
ncbi:MAG: hypothetical protein H6833_12805 [Planctomycetes bacterium]|nr:hypothetical protein [Planctomycetota bacterium]